WPAYAGTYASAKYSPLDQIHAGNAASLQIAWRWKSPDAALRAANPGLAPSYLYEATPLMLNGVLYTTTSLSQVAAIDAASGETKWVFDPGVHKRRVAASGLGWVHRGVAYWRDGADERLILLSGDATMVALDARTGKPIERFGAKGQVDLAEGLSRRVADRSLYTNTSPPVIVRGVIVVGSVVPDFPHRGDMPPGDVRGYDVRTGKRLWTFRAVPAPGEAGHETWGKDSWKNTGNTNAWAPMSADEELGIVYMGFAGASNIYYGGDRPGDNLFSESLVGLDARTGKRVWHFQIARHGIWDYDLPAAPNLIDVTVAGRRVKAVAQVTKQGFVFVLDRTNGAPLWPVEDRAVPQSTVAGEKTAATQPFPTKPAAFEIQGVREDDLLDFTPKLRREALEIVRRYDHGPLYTPPSERGAILMPSVYGAANWSGASFDPETAMFYVPTIRHAIGVKILRASPEGREIQVGQPGGITGPQGLSLFKPPWGSVVAIDMGSGEHRWRAPVGTGDREHRAIRHLDIKDRLGWPTRSFVLVTKSLLLVVQHGAQIPRPAFRRLEAELSNLEPKLYAYDKASGRLIAEIPLPANAGGAPMTYLAGGKQYVAFPVGGSNIPEELIALSLPWASPKDAP
ncbi:MAG: PQQ-binding-like beta-propeller repeat protein, partial [Burkholderiales bacterium]